MVRDKANGHLYEFANRSLPAVFFDDPGRVLSNLRESPERFLDFLWNKAGSRVAAAETLDGNGLRVHTSSTATRTTAIIELPTPEAPPEPFLIALIGVTTGADAAMTPFYFALELFGNEGEPERDADGAPRTALCRWEPGLHVNYGRGGPPSPRALAERTHEIVDGLLAGGDQAWVARTDFRQRPPTSEVNPRIARRRN